MGSTAPVPAKGSRERLIASHLPLVKSIARRYVGKGEELDDLVQVGSLALIKASDRFDPARGVAFASFAAPVIEGEIRHHLRDRTAPVRVPRELEQIRARLRGRGAELRSKLGRAPTTEELAAALGVKESEIDRALTAERVRDSVSVSSELPEAPLPADGGALTPSDDRLLLASSMRSLDERERQIVFLRFHADMTERQIAGEVGLSQAHVSRLLKGALTKLRTELAEDEDTAVDGSITSDIERPNPRGSGTTKLPQVGRAASVGTTGNLTLADYLALPYHIDVAPERDGEQSHWTASVAELNGCVARGDTAEQAVARLRPAMESWLTSAIAEQREIPIPGKKIANSRSADSYSGRFLVRMPKPLHAQLASAAEQQQVSLNRLVTEVLTAAVERGDLGSSSRDSGETPNEVDEAPHSQRTSPRSIRVALATNLVVVVLAGIVALVLLVLALQRGI